MRRRRKERPDLDAKERDKQKAYYEQHPHKKREKVIKSRYGLSLPEYAAMVERPCEVCGKEGDSCVDHDHSTGLVRGTLCKNCNSAIGLLDEDVLRIMGCVRYLQTKRAAKAA